MLGRQRDGDRRSLRRAQTQQSDEPERLHRRRSTQVDGQTIDVIEPLINRGDRHPFVEPVREHFAGLAEQSGRCERRDARDAIDLAVRAAGLEVRSDRQTAIVCVHCPRDRGHHIRPHFRDRAGFGLAAHDDLHFGVGDRCNEPIAHRVDGDAREYAAVDCSLRRLRQSVLCVTGFQHRGDARGACRADELR